MAPSSHAFTVLYYNWQKLYAVCDHAFTVLYYNWQKLYAVFDHAFTVLYYNWQKLYAVFDHAFTVLYYNWQKLYAVCDVALGLIQKNLTNVVLKDSNVDPTLPSKLYTKPDRVSTIIILPTNAFRRGVFTGVIRHSGVSQSVGKSLCLKLPPQCSSYLNETCYT